MPTADKVALAIELEAATKAIDPRIRGLRSASYGDTAAESAIVNVARRGSDHAAHGVLVLRLRDGERRRRDADRWRLLDGPGVHRPRPRQGRERRGRALGAAVGRHAAGVTAPPRGARSAGHAVARLADRLGAVGRRRCRRGGRCSSGTRARTSPRRASPSSTTRRSSTRSAPPATTPRGCRRAGSSSSAAAGSTRSCTTSTPPAAAAPRAPVRPCAVGSSRRRASARVRCISSPGS